LAAQAHWPAVDLLESISRLFPDISPEPQRAAAQAVRELVAAYREHEDLISIGAYRQGASATVDAAIAMREDINRYLRQAIDERSSAEAARSDLLALAQRCLAARKPPAIPTPAKSGK
jgi:flagellar biosynthesis/type III secretory pathway ATPase